MALGLKIMALRKSDDMRMGLLNLELKLYRLLMPKHLVPFPENCVNIARVFSSSPFL